MKKTVWIKKRGYHRRTKNGKIIRVRPHSQRYQKRCSTFGSSNRPTPQEPMHRAELQDAIDDLLQSYDSIRHFNNEVQEIKQEVMRVQTKGTPDFMIDSPERDERLRRLRNESNYHRQQLKDAIEDFSVHWNRIKELGSEPHDVLKAFNLEKAETFIKNLLGKV